MRERLLTWWLRRGGAVLIAACVTSWLLPLPAWVRGLWNLVVFAGCMHLLLTTRSRRKREQDGGGGA